MERINRITNLLDYLEAKDIEFRVSDTICDMMTDNKTANHTALLMIGNRTAFAAIDPSIEWSVNGNKIRVMSGKDYTANCGMLWIRGYLYVAIELPDVCADYPFIRVQGAWEDIGSMLDTYIPAPGISRQYKLNDVKGGEPTDLHKWMVHLKEMGIPFVAGDNRVISRSGASGHVVLFVGVRGTSTADRIKEMESPQYSQLFGAMDGAVPDKLALIFGPEGKFKCFAINN